MLVGRSQGGEDVVGVENRHVEAELTDAAIDLPPNVLAQVPDAFQEAVKYQTPYHWAGAYALAALLLGVLALFPAGKEKTG